MLPMSLKNTFFVICLISYISAINAQESNTWSLNRCLEYAEDNNLQLKQFRLRYNTSEIDLKQAKANRLPSLGANASLGLRFGLSLNQRTNTLETLSNTSLNVGAGGSLPVFNGLQLSNSIKQSQMDLEAAGLDIFDSKNSLYLDIATAYLNTLLNQELLEQSNIQVASTREQLDRSRRLVEAGTAARNTILELQAQLATDETNVVNTRNQLELSYLQLIQLLDLDPGQSFSIDEPSLNEISGPLHPAASQGIYEYAESTQPSVQAADLRIKSAEKGIDIARGAMYPSLSFNYNVSTAYVNRESVEDQPFSNQIDDNLGYVFSLGMNIPIFNRRQIRTGIERSQLNLKDAELQSRIVRQQLRQAIEQSYLDAVNSYSQYQQVIRQIESLQLAFDNAEKQFNVGMINSVDYVLAQNNLQRAELDRIRLKYQYIFSVKVLEFYQGEDLGF